MKIAFDARWIFSEISGIGNYARQLLREFARMKTPHRILVLFNRPDLLIRTREETGMDRSPHMDARCIPWGVFDLRGQVGLPRLLHREDIRVFHSPNYLLPYLAFKRGGGGRIRAVSTIHDLIPLRFPDHAPRSRKSRLMPVFRGLLRESANRSDRILTVSNASRDDIIRFLHPPVERVRVVYNGVDSRFQPETTAGTPRDQPPGEEYRLLYVGRSDPYKNITVLLHALAALRKTSGLNVRLRIAGAPDPRYPEPATLARSLGVSDSVEWTGYLSDPDLLTAYRQADLLVHPSRYEGFGLQILEAMACGTPVVSSHAGALPEVVGDAGILVPPEDVDAFTDAIRTVLTSPDMQQRMRADGLRQAARFSWTETARETFEAYLEAGDSEKEAS